MKDPGRGRKKRPVRLLQADPAGPCRGHRPQQEPPPDEDFSLNHLIYSGRSAREDQLLGLGPDLQHLHWASRLLEMLLSIQIWRRACGPSRQLGWCHG